MNKDMILLQQGAKLLDIELDDKQLALFNLYQSELLKWNAKTNLISEKRPVKLLSVIFSIH